MYYAQIDDYYVRDGAVYYHVVGRLDVAPILKHRLNRSEQQAEAVARWELEQHWLADWNHAASFEGFYPNCTVAFEINSSTYYPTMRHKKKLEHVRNINVSGLVRCGRPDAALSGA